jgi:hypothetical protein
MRKMRRRVVLNDVTWRITESVSATKTPPISSSSNCAPVRIAAPASAAPSASEPVSPMKTFAGCRL